MDVAFRLAGPGDADKLARALQALSAEMGDGYQAEDRLFVRHAFGPDPVLKAVLAEASGQIVGVAVFSPFLSTTRGRIGAFVTDLWVSDTARGAGLGRRLLAQVRDRAETLWGPTFLRLNYYHDNARAAAFYARLGFASKPQEVWVTLEGAALKELQP